MLTGVADIALQNLGGKGKLLGAVAVHLLGAALLGIKVVLAWLARNKLATTSDFDALTK